MATEFGRDRASEPSRDGAASSDLEAASVGPADSPADAPVGNPLGVSIDAPVESPRPAPAEDDADTGRSDDRFPSTPVTWLTELLADDGSTADARSRVNEFIMRIYERPLRRYFQYTRERWLRNGTEIVHGFFADRLDRPEFFAMWQSSGKSLRDWLKNAFSFYLKEECRRVQRNQRVPDEDRLPRRPEVPRPEEAFDRAYAQEVVREALDRTRVDCRKAHLELNWQIFYEHYYLQIPYSGCAPGCGLTEEQAAVRARAAVRRFRTVVRELVARDGFTAVHVDREIRALLEVTQ